MVSTIYVWDLNMVSIMPADGLAPNGARPSAGTLLSEQLDTFYFKFPCISMIQYYLRGIVNIKNFGWDLPEYLGTLSV